MEIKALRISFPAEGKRFVLRRVRQTLESGNLTNARNVRDFEAEFARFTGTKYAVAVSTGSTAVESTLRALGINKGQVVFAPTLTAPPTVYSSIYAGAKVVLVDSRREDLGMDPKDLIDKIERFRSYNLGAIIPVHVGGIISPNVDEMIKIGNLHGMPVIEDCAHAHGATYRGIKAGARGIAGTFSFFLTKVLTSGEGGAVVTDSEELCSTLRKLRNYGKDEKGSHCLPGSNWRMNEFTGAVALWQAMDAPRIVEERRRVARLYDQLLKDIPGLTPLKIPEGAESSYYKYVVFIDEKVERAELKRKIKEKYGVELTGEVYATPCHREPVFTRHPAILNSQDRFPQAEDIAARHICLPIYPGLTNKEISYVVASLQKALG